MIRHLRNANELILYASISCTGAYIARLLPPLHTPILLLRLAILAYCLYVIGNLEKNREFAVLLVGALFLGWIGGYWDYLELLIKYDSSQIVNSISGALLFLLAVGFIIYQMVRDNAETSKK